MHCATRHFLGLLSNFKLVRFLLVKQSCTGLTIANVPTWPQPTSYRKPFCQCVLVCTGLPSCMKHLIKMGLLEQFLQQVPFLIKCLARFRWGSGLVEIACHIVGFCSYVFRHDDAGSWIHTCGSAVQHIRQLFTLGSESICNAIQWGSTYQRDVIPTLWHPGLDTWRWTHAGTVTWRPVL